MLFQTQTGSLVWVGGGAHGDVLIVLRAVGKWLLLLLRPWWHGRRDLVGGHGCCLQRRYGDVDCGRKGEKCLFLGRCGKEKMTYAADQTRLYSKILFIYRYVYCWRRRCRRVQGKVCAVEPSSNQVERRHLIVASENNTPEFLILALEHHSATPDNPSTCIQQYRSPGSGISSREKSSQPRQWLCSSFNRYQD